MHCTNIYRRSLNITLAIATFGLSAACVSSPRSEPAGSAIPPNASSGKMQSYAVPPPQTASRAEDRETQSTEGLPVQQAPAAVPALRRAEPSKEEHGASNLAPARTRGQSPKAAAADKKAGGASETMLSRPDDLRVDPLVPSLADPPDVRVALQDFQAAADKLTAGHGCDEGCRAFQSMQRAAARICDLVSNRDPTQRCAAARTRVSAAEHDLKVRCGDCSS